MSPMHKGPAAESGGACGIPQLGYVVRRRAPERGTRVTR
jgi:hypothetical protein